MLKIETLSQQPALTLISEQYQLPATLNSLLVARLDRLTHQVKEVVQTASILGREFEPHLLEEMLARDLTKELDLAEESQIWASLNHLKYMFKHALMRDAAYEMQLRSRLRKLHYLAATTAEKLYAHQLSTYYDTLAYHYETAYLLGQHDVYNQAYHYLYQAGQQAINKYEHHNAIDYFTRALKITPIEHKKERYNLYLGRQNASRTLNLAQQENDLVQLMSLANQLGNSEKAEVHLRSADYAEFTHAFDKAIVHIQQTIALSKYPQDQHFS